MPKPAIFEVIPAIDKGHETVRLTLGNPNLTEPITMNGNKGVSLLLGKGAANSPRCFIFEVDHREHANLKSAKHRLAAIALEELVGFKCGEGGNEEIAELDEDDWDGDTEEAVIERMGERGLLDADDITLPSFSGYSGYDWEVTGPVQADVEQYVAGLLWNLQTYKDGVCADYAYNYGRRISPTSSEICHYLQQCIDNNVTLALDEILPDRFIPPLNAGLSCLAALPSLAKHIIPEPYRLLAADDAVEDIYGRCMNATTNVFDIEKFRRLCSDELQRKMQSNVTTVSDVNGDKIDVFIEKEGLESVGRRIRTSSRHWTVFSWSKDELQHPFAPPDPFSDRFNPLRHNPRIRASHVEASVEPKWMVNTKASYSRRRGRERVRRRRNKKIARPHAGWVYENQSILEVAYKRAFASASEITVVIPDAEDNDMSDESEQQDLLQTNLRNHTALAILKMLTDTGFFSSEIKWKFVPCANQASEIMNLSLEMGTPPIMYSWEVKRILGTKRRKGKHHLASKALTDIFGREWMNLTVDQMRSMKDDVGSATATARQD